MSTQKYSDDELLALSGIQHFFFCKRQWALIHVEQQWEEDQRTAEGQYLHKRADDPSICETRGEVIVSRAYPLVSYSLGLYGIADVIEYIKSPAGITLPGREGLWRVFPVEYKRGKPKIDERDEVQLCAQAICLEEMLHTQIDQADFFYHEIRRRVHFTLTDEIRNTVYSLSEEMHFLFKRGITPVASMGTNCRSCSLVEICLPQLTRKSLSVDHYIHDHIREGSQSIQCSEKKQGNYA